MTLVMRGNDVANLNETRKVTIEKRSTAFRKVFELACGRALFRGGFGYLPRGLTVGIIGVADFGDRYPEMCNEVKGRLRPHEFSSSVLNSAVGHCAIVFGLTGPQIHITQPADPLFSKDLARLLLMRHRADVMLVAEFVDETREVRAAVFSWEDGR